LARIYSFRPCRECKFFWIGFCNKHQVEVDGENHIVTEDGDEKAYCFEESLNYKIIS